MQEIKFRNEGPDFLDDLCQLVSLDFMQDVKLICQDGSVRWSALLLSQWSGIVREILAEHAQCHSKHPLSVILPDVNVASVERLLDWSMKGQLRVSTAEANELESILSSMGARVGQILPGYPGNNSNKNDGTDLQLPIENEGETRCEGRKGKSERKAINDAICEAQNNASHHKSSDRDAREFVKKEAGQQHGEFQSTGSNTPSLQSSDEDTVRDLDDDSLRKRSSEAKIEVTPEGSLKNDQKYNNPHGRGADTGVTDKMIGLAFGQESDVSPRLQRKGPSRQAKKHDLNRSDEVPFETDPPHQINDKRAKRSKAREASRIESDDEEFSLKERRNLTKIGGKDTKSSQNANKASHGKSGRIPIAITCSLCSRVCSCRDTFIEHLCQLHYRSATLGLWGRDDPSGVCPFCEKTVSGVQRLRTVVRHLARSHGLLFAIVDDRKVRKQLRKLGYVPWAGKAARLSWQFCQNHYKERYPGCDVCRDGFAGPMELKEHLACCHFLSDIVDYRDADYASCKICNEVVGKAEAVLHVSDNHKDDLYLMMPKNVRLLFKYSFKGDVNSRLEGNMR